ncbi:peptide-methionine (S)-S-oxide reductase MsrA [Paucibacter sp. JuS9]|uniref:peptide-methionine (S)-S-oxide reductase MsrA n=1 Tax=Paucibacter sp. JuS9 TaxID=3228748 RepID=UPI00375783AB
MNTLERITLAGGCFWCTEAVYEQVRGVQALESGYAMGHVKDPNYEQVCSGNTGHAEVLRIDFDPQQVSLRELLEVFFVIHDPTTLNRQGADVGTQYRSGIYFHMPEQEAQCRAVLDEVQQANTGKVVTELAPIRDYWPAEPYHQHYYARHPDQGYCAFVVAGKVEKFRKTFARLMRNDTE